MTDVFRLLTNCQRDVRALSAKLTELQAHLSAMSLEQRQGESFMCLCGLSFGTAERLAEHGRNVHDVLDAAPPPSVPWVPVHVHEGDR